MYKNNLKFNYVESMKMMNLLNESKVSRPMLNEQTVYHCSPYQFDEFEFHEGEGEGHADHGFGLYFMGDEQVANKYYSKNREWRYRYIVDIPDDDGTNYFCDNQLYSPDELVRIFEAFNLSAQQAADVCDRYAREPRYDGYALGFSILSALQHLFRSQRKTSEYLYSLGFLGDHYRGGRDGDCYCMFNPQDCHIRWMDDLATDDEEDNLNALDAYEYDVDGEDENGNKRINKRRVFEPKNIDRATGEFNPTNTMDYSRNIGEFEPEERQGYNSENVYMDRMKKSNAPLGTSYFRQKEWWDGDDERPHY